MQGYRVWSSWNVGLELKVYKTKVGAMDALRAALANLAQEPGGPEQYRDVEDPAAAAVADGMAGLTPIDILD